MEEGNGGFTEDLDGGRRSGGVGEGVDEGTGTEGECGRRRWTIVRRDVLETVGSQTDWGGGRRPKKTDQANR